jgi:phosphomannomutase
VAHDDLPAGIMVTASHNPPEYNGLKFIGPKGLAIGEDAGLHEIKPLLKKPQKNTSGKLKQHSYLDEFVHFTVKKAGITASEREVFIDGSGGVFGEELKRLLELYDFNFKLFNCEIDPEFKEHPPNPLEPEATEPTREYCAMQKCLGMVMDADGDRSIFVDEEGYEVPGDYFGAWIAQRTFGKGDGATSTVRDSRAVRDTVRALQGRFVLGKVGHANIQKLMVEENLRLGTEKSGHVFFKESHNAENGLYGLLLVLKHLKEGERLADGAKKYREKYLSSPEINFKVQDRKETMRKAVEHYGKKGELNTMDGVLCEGDTWWVNIRPSNTEPLVRLTFEAQDKETYTALEAEARSVIDGEPAKAH